MSNKSATPGHSMSDRSFAPDDFQTAYSPSFDSDILTRSQGASDMTIATRPASAPTAAPTGSAARRRSSQRLPDAGNTRSWWIMALMVSAFSFCMVMQFRQSPYELSSKPIDTIRLGDNVPGVNPAEADDLTFGTTVDRESWRHVRLTGRHASGALIEIDLLRPASWLTAHKAEAGAVIPVEFGRIGIVGPVMVESILECPEIRAGPGQSVTGIYRHHDAPTILDLETSDGERIGVTPDHRFWSVDQQAFVPAGDLVRGETLKLLDGTTRLASITQRRDSETVYTLEVQVEHVYHVAKSGVLVHNCETGISGPNALPQLRQAYIRDVQNIRQTSQQLLDAGFSPEAVARRVHALRREIGVRYKNLTPPERLAEITARNLRDYGDELGPTIESLRGRGKSWQQIIESASRPGGKDLGLAGEIVPDVLPGLWP